MHTTPRFQFTSVVAMVTWLTGIACSKAPSGTINITTGGEVDALTREPAPVALVVDSIAIDGTAKEISRTALPASELDLGSVSQTDVGALRVSAIDASGTVLLQGESLPIEFGLLANTQMSVFVQRMGEFARLPQTPSYALASPIVGIANGRYIFWASGTSTGLYDLFLLAPTTSAPVLSRAAKSMAIFGTTVLVIDDSGATTLDLTTGSTSDIAAPTGGNFGDVAGGAAVYAPDGSLAIVGATREANATSATSRVLRIDASGTATFVNLATPRAGACAAWVEGHGLVVYGGSSDFAGAEVLDATATTASPLAFPPDPVIGCGATALDGHRVIIAGGQGSTSDPNAFSPARVIDVACASNCVPAPATGAAEVPLARAQASTVGSDVALVVGDDANGQTRAYRVTPTDIREIALKVPRSGGRLVTMPTGGAAVVGGAPEIEQYRE
ncbi:MAG: hypothetical protein FWD73_08285 [Polyangiaceae bacterium]|nr:hypothetical protein [Polyangiaceae bacterium]